MPTKADFEAGAEWDGTSEPNHENGNWAQSYAVIEKLAEMAAEYDGVKAEIEFTLACHDPVDSAPGEFLTAWANAVTIATEGAIDFNIGYSGTHSGTMKVVDDMVGGAIDFGWTLPCYFKGYFPHQRHPEPRSRPHRCNCRLQRYVGTLQEQRGYPG